MAPAASLQTHRYQAGGCVLEITAADSSLSQWSDRPILGPLRFALWQGQRRLCSGNQRQLLALAAAVDSQVQQHLGNYTWPETHRFVAGRQTLKLTTRQLYELAEVLYRWQHQYQLLPPQSRPSRRLRLGTAAALLLTLGGIASQLPWPETSPEAQLEIAEDMPATDDAAPDIAASEPQTASPESLAAPRAGIRSAAQEPEALAEALAINSDDVTYPLKYQIAITTDGTVVRVQGLNKNALAAPELLLGRPVPPPPAPLELSLVYELPGVPTRVDPVAPSPDADAAGSGP